MPSQPPTTSDPLLARPRLERLESREVPTANLLTSFETVSADQNEATTGQRVNPPDAHGAARLGTSLPQAR